MKKALLLLLVLLGLAAALGVYSANEDTPTIIVGMQDNKIVRVPGIITRIAIGDPTIVTTQVITGNEIMLNGLILGSTSLHVWLKDQDRPLLFYIHCMPQWQIFALEAKKIDGVYSVSTEIRGLETIVTGFVRDQQVRERVMKLANVYFLSYNIRDGLLLPGEEPPLTASDLVGPLTLSDTQVITKLFTPRSRAAADLNALLTSMLSTSGRILVDATTNTMIVIDIPENVETIGRFIKRLDEQAQNQVMIETKFIELSQSATEELGVTWGLNTTATRGTGGITATANGTFTPDSSRDRTTGISQVIFDAATGNFKDLVITNLTATLSALEKQGKLNTLSAPRVTTVNGKLASVDIKSYQSYISGWTFTYDDAGNITSGTPQTGTVDYGITLTVTPTIGKDDIVTMDVTPTVRILQSLTSTGGQYPVYMPLIDERTTTVTVMLKDGGTLIIAGLMSNQTNQGTNNIPLLGRIPLIGRLFGKTHTWEDRTNLTIFITANIIKYRQAEEAQQEARPAATR